MKKLRDAIIILFLLHISFAACKKDNTAHTTKVDPPVATKNDIIGSWKSTKTIVDINENDTIDATDPVIIDSTISNDIITFLTTGKAMESYDLMVKGAVSQSDTFHFNWSWAGSSELNCVYTDTGITTAFHMHIRALDSVSMTLKDTCYNCYGYKIYALPKWIIYTKL
jgi:hypothetical protein